MMHVYVLSEESEELLGEARVTQVEREITAAPHVLDKLEKSFSSALKMHQAYEVYTIVVLCKSELRDKLNALLAMFDMHQKVVTFNEVGPGLRTCYVGQV